jgi:DNA-directed RNA polymerase sigma subunit (sigma70/sigma32)
MEPHGEYLPIPPELIHKATSIEMGTREIWGIPTDETLLNRTDDEYRTLLAIETAWVNNRQGAPSIESSMDVVLLALGDPGKTVLRGRFGLAGRGVDEPEEIARVLGLTPEKVLEIEEEALTIIRSPRFVQFLREFHSEEM